MLGLASGVLGSFAVLRRQGLMGDALSHAALPGVCLAYMVTGQKTSLILLIGAALAATFAMGLIVAAVRRVKTDSGTAMAVFLTAFFGLGLVLLTKIQQRNDAGQAGLDKFLFGQAAALVTEQVVLMAVVGGFALLIVVLFYPQLKLSTFDPQFASSLGWRVRVWEALQNVLLVSAICIGLNTVGVVLMSAMMVAPAIAARQWTNQLGSMLVLAACFGMAGGAAGTVISLVESKVPTGPVIVLSLTVFVTVSVLFGTARGIIPTRLRALTRTSEEPI